MKMKNLGLRFKILFLPIFLVIFFVSFNEASAAISFVQKVPNSGSPKETTSATALTSDSFTSQQNDLIVGIAYVWNASSIPSTVTWADNKGNTWIAYKSSLYSNYYSTYDLGVYIGYAIASAGYGSGHTVTVSGFSSSTEISLGILEFSGVDTAAPVISGNSNSGRSTLNFVSGSVSPSGNALYVGGLSVGYAGGDETISNAWTSATMAHSELNSTYSVGADSYLISTGSQQAAWSHNIGLNDYYSAAVIAFREAATKSVYYSVGQDGSTDRKVAANVTLSGGSATFTVAQTGNIGVGDRVTYGQKTVSGVANLGGTPNQVRLTTSAAHGYLAGDYVAVAGTTNYNGTYVITNVSDTTHFDIVHSYTSSQSGNANFVGYISAKTNTDQQNWSLVTPVGVAPRDISSLALSSITREYTSLSAAEAGATDSNHLNTADLVAGNYQLNFPCYYDTAADTTAVTVNGYTTSSSNFIKIYTPNNTATEANQSQRHSGKWARGKYTIETTTGDRVIYINDPNVTIEGLQVENKRTSEEATGLNVYLTDGSANVRILENIVRYVSSGASTGYGIIADDAEYATHNYAVNNIVYGFVTYGVYLRGPLDSARGYMYNNTVYNCGTGMRARGSYSVAKNNLVHDCATPYLETNSFHADSTNNSYNSGSGIGSNRVNLSAYADTDIFSDPIGQDFHLKYGSPGREVGSSLSSDSGYSFSKDIDAFQVRPSASIWDIGADEGAIPVYYSVGQATGNLETGAGTVSISSGVATFSVAQTGNIGVGDRITYNTSNIAYISGKTDTSTWTVVTATGGVPANVTDATVNAINHVFTTISGAEAGATGSDYLNTSNLLTGNYQLNIPCYYDSAADTTAVSVSGYTTGAANYIRIYTPSNVSSEANNSQRHGGKWNDRKYSLVYSGSSIAMNILDAHIRLDGLQIYFSSGAEYASAINKSSYTSGSWEYQISNNIIKGSNSSSLGQCGIFTGAALTPGSVSKVWNNVVYDIGTHTSSFGIDATPSYGSGYVYNNVVFNAYSGYLNSDNGGLGVFKNNIAQNCTNGFWAGWSWGTGSDYNISDLANDAPSASYRNDLATTVKFEDAPNRNLHLSLDDTGAKNAGVDLSSDAALPIGLDIDNHSRNGIWDIGPDEVADRVYYSVGQNATTHETGAGNVTVDATARTATFTVPQTATNMGVGDVIDYDSDNKLCYITEKVSTSVWKCQGATGGAPTAATGATVNLVRHAFASLSLAEEGASALLGTADLVAGNYQLNFPCYYDTGADTTAVTIDGWTTGESNYIKIYTPIGTDDSNSSQRHSGLWSATKYNLSPATGIPLTLSDENVRTEGLEIYSTNDHSLYVNGATGASSVYLSSNIIKGNATTSKYGINLASTGSTSKSYIYNNIAYDYSGTTAIGLYQNDADWTTYFYNNTLSGNTQGINNNAGAMIAKNNLVTGSGNTNTYIGTFTTGTDYNATDGTDDIGTGSNNRVSQTFSFVDSGGKNFHLASSDTSTSGHGISLSSDSYLPFSDDIDGQTRPVGGTWDIGADETGQISEIMKGTVKLRGNVKFR